MRTKKALVFGETIGFDESFEQIHYKPTRPALQPLLEFIEPQAAQPKTLDIIECFECKRHAELDGFRFRLVPLCRCCRTDREVEIVAARFERRMRKYE